MDYDTFVARLTACLRIGTELDNPRKGTSTILSTSGGRVCYRRGGTDKLIDIRALYDTYANFSGGSVTTDDLIEYDDAIYGDNATPCHRTFFLMVLKEMRVVDRIRREGRHFGLTIPPIQPANPSNG